jgi:hypothetical protein
MIALRPTSSGLERRVDHHGAALLEDLKKLGAPFSTPKGAAVDVGALRSGPLKDALTHALAAVKGAGEGGNAGGVYALRPAGRDAGPVLGYVAIGYGGDAHGAWSAVSYLNASGRRIGDAFEEA